MEGVVYKQFAGTHALLLYDVENLPSGVSRLREIPKLILKNFPGISITYAPYGDCENLLHRSQHQGTDQRKWCLRAGGHIRDVTRIPGPNPNNNALVPWATGVADRAMMQELFSFASQVGPSNLVVLVSCDNDFSTPLNEVRNLGLTTILICNPLHTNGNLIESAHFVYDWNNIMTEGFFGGRSDLILAQGFNAVPSELPTIIPLAEGYSEVPRNSNPQTIVLWDRDSVALPAFLGQTAAEDLINQNVILPNLNHVGEVTFYVYGSRLRERDILAEPEKYIRTSTHPNEKQLHMENCVITRMGIIIFENGPQTNVIVVSRNTNFAGPMTWLVQKGHTVGSVGGGVDEAMRKAASFTARIPKWQ